MAEAKISHKHFWRGDRQIFYYCQKCGTYRGDQRADARLCDTCSKQKKVYDALKNLGIKTASLRAATPKDSLK